jgi:hypothetical protein
VKAVGRARSLAALPDVDGYCSTATFTDNIVVGYPIDDTGSPPLSDPDKSWAVLLRVLASVAAYQLELSKEGLFVRGGIAIGPIWLDDLYVFGSGLNDAYKIESTHARYPRIVVSEQILELAVWLRPQLKGASQQWLTNYFVTGWDGEWFVNYLWDEYTRDAPDSQFLEVHKQAVASGLFDSRGNPAVYEKYLWLRTYHNFFCEALFEPDKKLDVPPELYEFFSLAQSPDGTTPALP